MDAEQSFVEPNEITVRAAAVGLSAAELSRRAMIHPTTFSRWLRGVHGINTDSYKRIMRELIAAERAEMCRRRNARGHDE
jgi:hypothetical protein